MITLTNITTSTKNGYFRYKAEVLIDGQGTDFIFLTEAPSQLTEEDLTLMANKEYQNYIKKEE